MSDNHTTTQPAAWAAANVDPVKLADALDHIARSARASRSQTRRLRWIERRATMTLEGREYRDVDLDLPKPPPANTHERVQRRLAYALRVQHDLALALTQLAPDHPALAEYREFHKAATEPASRG